MCQHCTDVNYRRISIFSTHRYYLFLISFAISNFVHACGKIFICLKYVWIKNKFVKTEGRQTSSSRAGALFLKKRNPDAEKISLLSAFRLSFFSAILIWIKKYFCLPADAPENGPDRYSWKEIQVIQARILQSAYFLFSVITASAQILWRKKYLFCVFFENLIKN